MVPLNLTCQVEEQSKTEHNIPVTCQNSAIPFLRTLILYPLTNLPVDINRVIAVFMGGNWVGWCVCECSKASRSGNKCDSWLCVMEMSSKFKGSNRGHRERGRRDTEGVLWLNHVSARMLAGNSSGSVVNWNYRHCYILLSHRCDLFCLQCRE